MKDNYLVLNIFESDYKHFLFKNRVVEQCGVKIALLAVSGILIDNENNTLIGVRSKVAQYDGWAELIPSGGIGYGKSNKMNTPEEQVIIELFEETNIASEHVKSVGIICLLYDAREDVYDIGLKISLDCSLEQFLNDGCIRSDEYINIRIVNVFELAKNVDMYQMLPTSAALLCHI
jgi:hypothetical protein